jgi:hypothetical protein
MRFKPGFLGSVPTPFVFGGALVYRTNDDTTTDFTGSGAVVTWEAEAYDQGGWWDAGSPTKLIVPAGVNAIRIYGGASTTSADSGVMARLTPKINGNFYLANVESMQTNTSRSISFATPVVPVNVGDEFELNLLATGDLDADFTYFCIEAVNIPHRALTNLNGSDLTAQDYTGAGTILYAGEEYDTDNIHDTGSNTDLLTVPVGYTMVRTTAEIFMSSVSSGNYLLAAIQKNAGFAHGIAQHTMEFNLDNDAGISLTSAPMIVTAGDTFRLLVLMETDNSVTVQNGANFFGMEIIDAASFSGALVHKSADQTTADYTAGAQIAWNAEEYDIGGWHDTVTDNSRLTVPSGVSRVRLYGNVLLDAISASNTISAFFIKNGGGARYSGEASMKTEISAATTHRLNIASPVLEVSPGDWFEFRLQVETDTSITVTALGSFFAIEKVT